MLEELNEEIVYETDLTKVKEMGFKMLPILEMEISGDIFYLEFANIIKYVKKEKRN